MERHPEKIAVDGITRKDGSVTPFNAADAVAAVCDAAAEHGIHIPPTLRARAGKTAKQLLEDGFSAPQVVTAMVIAIRRGRVDLIEQVALDVQAAGAGWSMSPKQYYRELDDLRELASSYFDRKS